MVTMPKTFSTYLLVLVWGFAAPALGDDSEQLTELFTKGAKQGGAVTIAPGDYRLNGSVPIPLASNMTIEAYGARFHLPEELGDKDRLVLFAGDNIKNLRWSGGHFIGNVFDPGRPTNMWPPNANTRAIVITTSAGGVSEDLTFRDITSAALAGAAITVNGAETLGSAREVETFARNITLENCSLQRTGKFMWDYGYLWQITVWPEEHSEAQRALASKYFRNDLIRGPVRMESGDDRVLFSDETRMPISPIHKGVEATRGHDTICFFNDTLPSNLIRGKQYFVVDSAPGHCRIAETAGGPPITFASAGGPDVKLIGNLFQSHLALYAPVGSGPGKGAFDLVGCENVIVRGCRLSALGDTMHIQKCRNIVFANNQITGSRMGAFFLAEYCHNATVVGNLVDGTNGSRVVSVEKSCEDVTIVGNTFRNGGRGSWINQPRNFILANNLFVNNTTKCETDPQRGRRSFLTGEYERYAELYFTTYELGGQYQNVVVRGNTFISGAHAQHAISFAPGGNTLVVADNVFAGEVRDITPLAGCENVTITGNVGLIDPAKPNAIQ